jgi:serine/threonine-protein kinase HipA
MSIQTISVYLDQKNTKQKVGTLANKSHKIYFEYEKEFLKTGIELSPYKLPLKSGVHMCNDRVFDGLFGVFADSLPDGWGRLLLDRYLLNKGMQHKEISPLDRLGYIGEFGIGALSYEPVSEKIAIEDNISLDRLATSSQEIFQGSSEELLDTLLAIGGSSAGARPKAMIQLDNKNSIIHGSQSLKDGYEHYMVKFPSSLDSKDIGKIEYIYSLMAKDANINIPNTKLLQTDNNSYFAIQRFDRVGDERVHIHSVAGLSHSDFRVPTVDYDDLLGLTLHLTKDKNEQNRMFRVAVFNLLTHNRDDHAKNFSFLLDSTNRWRLSPAYDLTFSFGPNGEHSTIYLGVGKNPTVNELKNLAKKHDIKESDTIIDEVQSAVSKFKEYAKDFGVAKSVYENIYKSFVMQ